MTEVVVGIDLGTTNMRIAQARKQGKNVSYDILENAGERMTPTTIAFLDENIIGKGALPLQVQNPENVVYGVKRLIGHKFNDVFVQNLLPDCLFKVVSDNTDDLIIEIQRGNETELYKPEEIISLLLGEAKKIIESFNGALPTKCTITVPVYFPPSQREKIIEAARIAGLNVHSIISENVAAFTNIQTFANFGNGNILLLDYGSSLNVSIFKVEESHCSVLAVSGNSSLGGENMDKILMNHMLERFKIKYPDSDSTINPSSMANLKQKCQEAKCLLSSELIAHVIVPSFNSGYDLNESICRNELESLCLEDFAQLIGSIDMAIELANISLNDVDHIIMIGGSSHIPYVQNTIEDHFHNNLKPHFVRDPDSVVAIGAAIYCNTH